MWSRPLSGPRIMIPATWHCSVYTSAVPISSLRAFLLVGGGEIVSYSSCIPVFIIVSDAQESVNKYLLDDWTHRTNASGERATPELPHPYNSIDALINNSSGKKILYDGVDDIKGIFSWCSWMQHCSACLTANTLYSVETVSVLFVVQLIAIWSVWHILVAWFVEWMNSLLCQLHNTCTVLQT